MENKVNLNHQIFVSATPVHQKNHVVVGANHVFSYTITIHNQSSEEVQLISRHWFITDGVLGMREVEGEGVVGQQPVLTPGDTFTYESWCPISEDFGSMSGYFTFLITRTGEIGYANIDTFLLIPNENLN